ncbi:hypothetical protein Droror1_Dr00027630 [Drosera rotundifolia]
MDDARKGKKRIWCGREQQRDATAEIAAMVVILHHPTFSAPFPIRSCHPGVIHTCAAAVATRYVHAASRRSSPVHGEPTRSSSTYARPSTTAPYLRETTPSPGDPNPTTNCSPSPYLTPSALVFPCFVLRHDEQRSFSF